MEQSHSQASHIISQIAYNSVYQIVRKKNNQVEMFGLEDVYHMTEKYEKDYRTVQNIFKASHEQRKSYGVRREFRIGGDAMEDVFFYLDESVSARAWMQEIYAEQNGTGQ